jgi:hypothetical protein
MGWELAERVFLIAGFAGSKVRSASFLIFHAYNREPFLPILIS